MPNGSKCVRHQAEETARKRKQRAFKAAGGPAHGLLKGAGKRKRARAILTDPDEVARLAGMPLPSAAIEAVGSRRGTEAAGATRETLALRALGVQGGRNGGRDGAGAGAGALQSPEAALYGVAEAHRGELLVPPLPPPSLHSAPESVVPPPPLLPPHSTQAPVGGVGPTALPRPTQLPLPRRHRRRRSGNE